MPAPTTRRPVAKRRLLKDEAHDAIQAAILDGTFAPGEKLDDQALTQWLGISRSPIREALNLLASEGFVEIQAQSSTSVVNPDPAQVEHDAQALGIIMGGVLRLAMPEFTPADRDEAIRLVEVGLGTIERRELARYLEAMGVGFFGFLIGRCPNPVVTGIAETNVPSLAFRIRIAGDLRTPNWDLLSSGWARVRSALSAADVAAAEQALAEIHRVVVSSAEWAPAQWAESRG